MLNSDDTPEELGIDDYEIIQVTVGECMSHTLSFIDEF
jgi:hypothetical protein